MLRLKIEEELHDARRVQSHGQEEDLRAALNMVINRVQELSSMLNEAYKAKTDLEVQLNVAKSNLQLVIANNEMLEEALRRDTDGRTRDVGWRRGSGRKDASRSEDYASMPPPGSDSNPGSSPVVPAAFAPPLTPTPAPPPSAPPSSQDSRFFRFRFTGSVSSRTSVTRPTTPSAVIGAHHLVSSSMPVLPTIATREIEELTAQLEKEREARKTITEEKAAIEAELESLSQALFEEANKMVATERMKRAETEEELKEARLEQEALRSALRLVEGENSNLREATQTVAPSSSTLSANRDADSTAPSSSVDQDQLKSRLELVRTRLRSSSQIAMKSPITSPRRRDSNIPFPASPPLPSANLETQPQSTFPVPEPGTEPHPPPPETSNTPIPTSIPSIYDIPPSTPSSSLSHSASSPALTHMYDDDEPSPWADTPSRTSADLSSSSPPATPRNSLFSAASVYT